MSIVSDVEIRLRADIARLQQDMDSARRTVGGAMDRIASSVDTAKSALQTLGAYLSFRAFVDFVKGAIDATDALNDLSSRTSISIEDLSKLSYAAKISDSSLEGIAGSVSKLATNMGKDADKFARLGITATEPLEAFKQLSDIFKSIQDPQTRAAFGADALGKSWQDAAVLLNEGSAGIDALMKKGEALAGVTTETAARAGEFNDKLDDLGFIVQGAGKMIASDLLPMLTLLVDDLTETANKAKEVDAGFSPLGETFRALVVFGGNVAFTFKAVGTEIGVIAAQIGQYYSALGQLFSLDPRGAWSTLKGAFGAGGIGDMAKADAEKAREAFDAWQQGWVDVGTAAQKVKEQVAEPFPDPYGIDANFAQEAAARAVAFLKDSESSAAAKKASDSAAASAKRNADSYKSLIDAVRLKVEETDREAKGLDRLTDSQVLAASLDRLLADRKLTLTSAEEARYRSLIATVGANEQLIKSNEKAKALSDQTQKAADELNASRQKSLEQARSEAESNEEVARTFGLSKQAIELENVARLQSRVDRRADLDLSEDEVRYLTEIIELRTRNAAAIGKSEDLRQQKELWESIEKTAHDTFVSILDGGKDAATRLKDTFKNVFFDWLYQQTLKKWIINLSGTASLSTAAGAAQAAGGAGAGGSGVLGNLLSGAGMVGSMFGAGGVGGALAAGAGWVTGASTFGGSLAAGSSLIGTGTLAGGLSGATMLVGTIAPIAIAAVLGSVLLKKAFGRGPKETTGQGITGSFGEDSFTGSGYTEWIKKGGWFRSDKRGMDTSPLAAETADALNSTYKALKESTSAFAIALGVPTDTISGYTKQIKLALTGDSAKDQKLLADLFTEMGDELASRVLPNIADFIQQGETAATTLQRLSVQFQAVDAVLATLSLTSTEAFGEVGVASLAARDRLVALSGGLDAMAQQTSFFADNFLSDAEKIAPAQKLVNEQLAKLGYAGLTTGEQFKDAVLGIASSGRLATEEGARTYAGLIALGPAFKAVTDYMAKVEEAGKAVAQAAQDMEASQADLLRNTAGEMFSILQRSIDARKKELQTSFDSMMERLGASIDSQKNRISRLSGLSSALAGATSGGLPGGSRASAQAQIASALAIARAGGYLPNADSLKDALAIVAEDSADKFSSFIEYQRDALLTQNSIEELSGITNTQLSAAEKSLMVMERQRDIAQAAYDAEVNRLDGLLSSAQIQIDAINGVNLSVMGVSAAFSSFQGAITSALKNKNIASGPSAAEAQVESLYQSVFGRASDAGGLAYWAGKMREGTSLDSIRDSFYGSAEYQSRQPPVYNAQQRATMVNGDPNAAAFDARMKSLEAAMVATANATTKFAAQFDQVSNGGNMLLTEIS